MGVAENQLEDQPAAKPVGLTDEHRHEIGDPAALEANIRKHFHDVDTASPTACGMNTLVPDKR